MAVVVAWRWTGRGLTIAGDLAVAVARMLPGHCRDVVVDSGGMRPGHGGGHPPDTKTLLGQGVGLALRKTPGFVRGYPATCDQREPGFWFSREFTAAGTERSV